MLISKATAICEALALNPKQAYHPKRESEAISAGTAHKGFAVLHELFEAALNWELIDRNPCSRIKPPKYPRKEVSIYTREQLITLFRYHP